MVERRHYRDREDGLMVELKNFNGGFHVRVEMGEGGQR